MNFFTWYWKELKEASTREGRQARYIRTHEKLTGTAPASTPFDPKLPMRRKQQKYNLEHININWQNKTVRVHLHGHKRGFITTKRIERMALNIVPNMTEQEAIRVAAFLSPNEWVIPASSPLARYKQHWNTGLDERLQSALTDPNRISVSNN